MPCRVGEQTCQPQPTACSSSVAATQAAASLPRVSWNVIWRVRTFSAHHFRLRRCEQQQCLSCSQGVSACRCPLVGWIDAASTLNVVCIIGFFWLINHLIKRVCLLERRNCFGHSRLIKRHAVPLALYCLQGPAAAAERREEAPRRRLGRGAGAAA